MRLRSLCTFDDFQSSNWFPGVPSLVVYCLRQRWVESVRLLCGLSEDALNPRLSHRSLTFGTWDCAFNSKVKSSISQGAEVQQQKHSEGWGKYNTNAEEDWVILEEWAPRPTEENQSGWEKRKGRGHGFARTFSKNLEIDSFLAAVHHRIRQKCPQTLVKSFH